ncbi:MAG TPA: signal peptidase I [Gemmatimonadaceae bacterium]|nr:signal peptidase I [Gemmatimonadaceae bacterium]
MAVAPKRPSKGSNVVAQARAKRGRGSARGRSSAATWEMIKSIVGAILIYLVIKTFFVEAYRIPSGSMIPTLLVGDWLFVNKLIYGPVIPFTNTHLPGYADPHRGDVVVFVSPPQIDQPEDPTPTLVKRLIGMPGDTLYMRAGLVYVNGIPQHQGFAAATNAVDPLAANDSSPLFAWQHRIELKHTRFGDAPATPTHDNWGPLLIPPQHYFMMGDNRYCSKDSRYWGIVPRANVRGRPLIVYYSYRPGFDPNSSDPAICSPDHSDRPLPFITDIRWGRIGHRVK